MNKWFFCFLFAMSSQTYAEEAIQEKSIETPAQEEIQGHWGLGAGYGWINDYPGAAQGRARYIVVPAYKGKHLTIDRQEGFKGELISQSRFKFSVSFSFLFPTDSDKIPARTGMPDLDWTLQLGPELQFYFIRTQTHTMFLRLPFRFVATTDFSHRFTYRDWNFAPSLRNIFYLGKGLGEITTRIEIDYASERFQDYFYQVDAQYATPTRPFYNARQGFLETVVGLSYGYNDLFPWTFFIGGNVYFLGDSKNRASPLLVETRNYSVMTGVFYYF